MSQARPDGGPGNHDSYLEEGSSQALPRQKKYPDELLDHGARMVADSGGCGATCSAPARRSAEARPGLNFTCLYGQEYRYVYECQ
jgi:hypothetical protein